MTHLVPEVTEWVQSIPGTQKLLPPAPGPGVRRAVRPLGLHLVESRKPGELHPGWAGEGIL